MLPTFSLRGARASALARDGLATLLLFTAACAAPAAQHAPPATAASATPRSSATPDGPVTLAADLEVRPLRPGVWLHVSRDPHLGPANGLLVERESGTLLIDTGWTDAQAERLLGFARDVLHRPVAAAVVTHSHADRMGGIAALRRLGVPVRGLDLTAREATAQGKPAPDVLFAAGAPVYTDARDGFEAFYPGPGHAPDNIVVYLPREHVLFGGCLVKAEDAPALGFVGDADLSHWPAAIEAVSARYGGDPDVVVVPGHGPTSGTGALRHTLELLAAHASPRS